MKITETFTEKMEQIQNNLVSEISNYYKENKAVECHIIGSLVEGTNDALSDVDIWVTFRDEDIEDVIAHRMKDYEEFGEIVILHEMQNNYPLDGIQTAVLYEVEDESLWNEELPRWLAYGLTNTILHWSPNAVVLGGSMIVGDPAISVDAVRKNIEECLTIFPELPTIKKAELEDFGGLYGALAFINQHREI